MAAVSPPIEPADDRIALGGTRQPFLARYTANNNSPATPGLPSLGGMGHSRVVLPMAAENDLVGSAWDTPGADGQSMREMMCEVVAADRWSLVALLRVDFDNWFLRSAPQDSRTTVVIAVYPESTTTGRAGDIVRHAWRALKKQV